MKGLKLLLGVGVLALLAGCMNYYQVTDTVNGTKYYTKSVKDYKSGAVSFTDKKSGARVTLQNHAVKPIDRDTYKENVR